MFKSIIRYLKSTKGNSLAEFAVTTAMMATLATTAAPKFSGVGEGAKEKKTMADIDKIVKSANNFYNSKVTTEGRGRFPGQTKYDRVGGWFRFFVNWWCRNSHLTMIKKDQSGFLYLVQPLMVLGPTGHNISVAEDDNKDGSFDVYSGG